MQVVDQKPDYHLGVALWYFIIPQRSWLKYNILYSRKIGGDLNLAVWRSGKRPPNLNPSNLNAIHVNKGTCIKCFLSHAPTLHHLHSCGARAAHTYASAIRSIVRRARDRRSRQLAERSRRYMIHRRYMSYNVVFLHYSHSVRIVGVWRFSLALQFFAQNTEESIHVGKRGDLLYSSQSQKSPWSSSAQ